RELSLVATPGILVYSTTRLIGSEQNTYPKIFSLPTSALPQGLPAPATRSIPTPTMCRTAPSLRTPRITDIPSLTFAAACTIASVHVRASRRFGARSMRVSPPRG
ncbi:hypothetical protein M404DRAFT_1007785, partial [Pisolithus tinctorius Marx 270]